MPRKKLLRNSDFPYHVVNRSNDRQHFPGELLQCWKIFRKILAECSQKLNTKTHAFVLMPNHFHLLITTPEQNLDVFMRDLQSKVSRRLSWNNNRNGHRFESRYKWSLVKTEPYYRNCIRYLYQNPQNGGISSGPSDYPFSTFREAIDQGTENKCLESSIFSFETPLNNPDWITFVETPFSPDTHKLMKNALKRKECRISLSKIRAKKKLQNIQETFGFCPKGA